ncbi:dihydrodipicolinate synthase family protein [Aporhodopirellula aestuarii]|uniref:Dihydrodipicolinate synthase family protein n=1 Tax=Aporhodopirellula aestuarii TaxID=2950107 RepID=A0ABT0U1M3_9BACT|nr:dihydrodipicolinate synthase family protein [Aporhodopirellula aestuarii]MCM2370539.1 dihydrodipicolinate synthase family protein [Aporhodopirellula aestuarii]
MISQSSSSSPDRLQGLIAATFTPMNLDGSLRLDGIDEIVAHLIDHDIDGMYVLGSTGEGLSLTFEERCVVAERFVESANGRIPVIVQCGSESLRQSNRLAAHAQTVGADAVSAVSPVYFKPDCMQTLVASMDEIASGAPDLPFYYYHIPAATGVNLPMVEFLQHGGDRIANLRGIKFTSPNVHELQTCIDYAGDRFEILWGQDESLYCGMIAGVQAAVGSTYNFAAVIYQQLMRAFSNGDLDRVRNLQSRSQAIVNTFVPYGPRAAQKAMMSMVGIDCGPSRLPIAPLSSNRFEELRCDLEAIGFFDWIQESLPVESVG